MLPTNDQTVNPSDPAGLGMFISPVEIYGVIRLGTAYWTVIRELQGEGLSEEVMAAVQPAFVDTLSDTRKAGRLLSDALDGIDWDWPRWHPMAKRRGDATVPELRQSIAKQALDALLAGALKPDLLSLAASLGCVLPKSSSKTAIMGQLLLLPAGQLAGWAEDARKKLLAAKLEALRREMGKYVAGRVARLAHEALRYEQLTDPGFVALRPNWLFQSGEDMFSKAPKKCRDLSGKILPMKEALRRFPTLPCERLDCHCDIYPRNSRGE